MINKFKEINVTSTHQVTSINAVSWICSKSLHMTFKQSGFTAMKKFQKCLQRDDSIDAIVLLQTQNKQAKAKTSHTIR
jgi:hypothetical protein